ncbi:Odorant receptor 022 [Nylanderia fulva]|uniref:Odorant receptor n=1 Tax=Nylanderia fulva TaxID=613905 RepID=A0A6G1LNR7_9HYME|nr:odorant receptor 46a-like [Nylanderia fulva]KAF3054236.1 Odorant receptor 022 [Nylanderia fulva]
MDLFPVNFFVFRFCGIWKEYKDNNLIICFTNFCYRYIMAILLYHFTIFEVIELVRMKNNIEALTEGLFLVLTYVTLCLKYLNFLVREYELRALLDCFRNKICQPRDSIEKSILKQYDSKAKRTACFYMTLCLSTGAMFVVGPLLTQDERSLPVQIQYIPYSITPLLPYVLTYIQQSVALIYGVLLNVSFDSLVYGFIIHTCGQIELLCHRLTEIFRSLQENNEKNPNKAIENFAITECVKHHILVYDIIHKIQSLFVWTVAALFFVSLITLCTSIYQMSRTELLSPEFFIFSMYLGSMMFQVFSYCWYGNELDLKNKNIAYALYASNWTTISIEQRKKLLFVMMKSQKGMILSFHGICTLNLNTFTWIMKTSYSAFNLLQQASN